MLKVTKKQGFTLSLEDIFFEKPQGGVNLTPTPPPGHFRVKGKPTGWVKLTPPHPD